MQIKKHPLVEEANTKPQYPKPLAFVQMRNELGLTQWGLTGLLYEKFNRQINFVEISKIENGRQKPSRSFCEQVAKIFSEILGRAIAPADLFPEYHEEKDHEEKESNKEVVKDGDSEDSLIHSEDEFIATDDNDKQGTNIASIAIAQTQKAKKAKAANQ